MTSEKQKVALGSIVASAGLTIAKAAVGLTSGSLAILSEAAHSLIDFVATVITYFAVRVGDKPADEEHHYGHGKIESVAALGATALLFLLSGVVAWEAVQRLFGAHPHAVVATPIAFLVIAASMVVDFFRARALSQTASRTSSQALEADALHFSSDLWSSLAVLVGLGGVAAGFPLADAAAALAVSILICVAGWRLGRRTIDTLTDTAPPGIADRIARIARRIGGVVEVERVRAREVGNRLFVDLVLGVSRALPLDRVAALKEEIERAIRRELPKAEVTVATEPRALDDESMLDRIMVIARNQGCAVHHVTVHDLRDKLAISLDLEVDGTLSLAQAHAIADALEAAIHAELGADTEVETHIEPLQAGGIAGRDAAAALQAEIGETIGALAGPGGPIGDIHDVRVRETPRGLVVNFHCYADAELPIDAVHLAVDALERKLKEERADVHRAIGHAEPARRQGAPNQSTDSANQSRQS
jgi:cation diffusion facilitator family transporter